MKAIERDYHMADPALTLKSQDVLDSIDRDITEFNSRGFSPAKRTAFETLINEFMAMNTDNYFLGLQQIATGTKNNTRVLGETKVNVVLTGVVNVWGIDSPQYDSFTEDESLSQLGDLQLLAFMEDFADTTEANLTALAGEGTTAATVTELRGLRTQFNTDMKNQRKAIKARNTGNNTRIAKGNQLYKVLVAHCNTGKNIWINVDESKHNDYVIYPTPTGNAGTVVQGNLAMGVIQAVDTGTAVIAAGTEFFLEAFDTTIRFYFMAGAGTAPPGPGDAFIDVQPGTSITVTATQLGWSASNGVLHVQNIAPFAGSYRITIEG